MELLGSIALAAMGMTLGLVGAGGAMLTIPILVYLLEVPIILATSYSLVVVGCTALIGLLRYRHHILFKRAIVFLIPSVLGVFTARRFMVPALPQAIGPLPMDKALVLLLLIFMSVSGYCMIKNPSFDGQNHLPKNQKMNVILTSLTLGTVMGLLGAGGGFLMIPALVLLMGFTMPEAVPTSLFMIAVNALIGFAADQHPFTADDWRHLATYLAPALLGMLIGLYTSKFIQGESLKKAFGYCVWGVGMAIFAKEFALNTPCADTLGGKYGR